MTSEPENEIRERVTELENILKQLRHAGAPMANILYNLHQRSDTKFTVYEQEAMKSCVDEWDNIARTPVSLDSGI